MRVIKMLGAALLGCAALMSVGVSAQQVVPVSCTWGVISSTGPQDNSWRDIVRECRESNSALVATQSFRGFANGTVSNCALAPAANISYTGACMSPSFSKTITSPTCTTPGMQVHGGFCANSADPALLTNPTYLARCGAGCSLEFKNVGWTSKCPNSGNGRSPEYGVFCK
jgi:hypothetical protein